MRSITLFVLSLFIAGSVAAQDKDQPKKKRDPLDKFILDLSYTSWLNTPKNISIKPYSAAVDLNLFFDLPFGASPFSFAWGAGFTSHNVHSNGSIVYRLDAQGNTFTAIEPLQHDYKINKLSLNYITIPVEFRLRSAKKPTFRFSAGGRVGYLINNHTKYVDDDSKIKVYRIRNIDPLLYGVTARIGVGRIQFTGFYGLSEIFKKGEGEEGLAPWSVGLNILPLVK